jgi:uncharacterized membrane protein (UPF0127 family)
MVLALVAGCSDDDDGATVTSSPQTVTASATPLASPTPAGPTVTFTNAAGDEVVLSVEVADDDAERSRGLMFRETLAENAGMIFVYTTDTQAAFYMRNTTVPLSIAFISGDGVIIDIQDMAALDETLHHAPAPYRYAVEANQGWFARNGIAVGDGVGINLLTADIRLLS